MSLFWNAAQLANTITGVGQEIERAVDNASIPAANLDPSPANQSGADERVDQLLLICAAMWDLMKEKFNLTEEDLINRVAILDAKDGTADGKLTYTPVKCPSCNRTIFPRHRRCLYCGAQVPIDSIFKTI